MLRFRYIFAGLILSFSFMAVGLCTPTPDDQLLMVNQTRLQTIKDNVKLGKASPYVKLTESICRWADGTLTQPLLSVTDKTVPPPSGDMHDYRSLSIYTWPDPTQSKGLPYVYKDGLVNPEINDLTRYDSNRLSKMTYNVEILSLAYSLTGKEVYATKAAEFLRAWFITPQTRMNPNLNFAQETPGKNNGVYSGIIDTVVLIKLVDAAKILETSPAFPQNDQTALQDWFRKYIRWLTTSDFGIKESKTTNNHSVWYNAQVASYAWLVGDTKLAAQVVEAAKTKQLAPQIEPDGSMPREIARTRSLHYVNYNLEAFITLARVGDKVGINLWDYQTPDGRSLKKAIAYVLPYLSNQKVWDHAEIVKDSNADFAKYLILAQDHYQVPEYSTAIKALLSEGSPVREKIACGMP